MFQKTLTQEEWQRLTESQNRTTMAIGDLDETVDGLGTIARGIQESAGLITDQAETANHSLDRLNQHLEKQNEMLAEMKEILSKIQMTSQGWIGMAIEVHDLRLIVEKHLRPPTRETMAKTLSEKIEIVFQKMQKHHETPRYSGLTVHLANGLLSWDTEAMESLPMAQLDALDRHCDALIRTMELCE
ncbi:MAG: hypothetical protein PHE53_14130 [Thermoguttaceae bacterium]|nr:hypothetical protein [Thermoguttaceae bacterium]